MRIQAPSSALIADALFGRPTHPPASVALDDDIARERFEAKNGFAAWKDGRRIYSHGNQLRIFLLIARGRQTLQSLARETGLCKATCRSHCERLVSQGLVDEQYDWERRGILVWTVKL